MAPSAPPVPMGIPDPASPMYVKKHKRVASVSKAAYPGMAGFVPEYEVKTQASNQDFIQNMKNSIANERAKSQLKMGSYKISMPRDLDSPARRRMHATEYRGPNMSDCMYHTMQSFNKGREHLVSPKMRSTNPDWNVPVGGVNLP